MEATNEDRTVNCKEPRPSKAPDHVRGGPILPRRRVWEGLFGRRVPAVVEATTRKPRLLPPRQPVPRPEWLVLGGLVFTPLLPDYECLVPKSKLHAIHGPPTAECRQVVILLRVLQSEVNIGYEDICGMLETFNGEPVASLAHLARMAEAAAFERKRPATSAGRTEAMPVSAWCGCSRSHATFLLW